MPTEPATAGGEPYDEFGLEDAAEDGYGYTPQTNEGSAQLYREMVEEDWVDEPLQDLLETRVGELLDG